MVRALRFGRVVLVVAAVGFASAAFALDLLEKLQAEVASIVKSSKGAVVTIEEDVPQAGWLKMDEDAPAVVNVNVGKEVAEAIREARKELSKLAEDKAEKRDRATERELRAKLRVLEESDETRKKSLEAARAAVEQSRKLLSMRIQKSGTGFSIGEGCVVTTADVVEGMERPIVITDDGTRIKAKVAGVDPDLNVAILNVPRRAELPSLKWGNSASAVPGFFAISIGNQTGQINSAALNLVAGVREEGTLAGKRFYPRLLQIAGTVGAGSSGAPLLNTKGEVIGMMAAVPTAEMPATNLMIPGLPLPPAQTQPGARRDRGVVYGALRPQPYADSQPAPDAEDDSRKPGHQGAIAIIRPPVTSAGFAVPSNDLQPVVEALREGRSIRRGFIGVTTLDDERYESDGDIARLVRVVRVISVSSDSPACKAGLQANDIILTFDGKPVSASAQVMTTARTSTPGQILHIEARRGGKTLKFEVTITERPSEIRRHRSKDPVKRSDMDPVEDCPTLRAADRLAY